MTHSIVQSNKQNDALRQKLKEHMGRNSMLEEAASKLLRRARQAEVPGIAQRPKEHNTPSTPSLPRNSASSHTCQMIGGIRYRIQLTFCSQVLDDELRRKVAVLEMFINERSAAETQNKKVDISSACK